jgi:hypothetical protein
MNLVNGSEKWLVPLEDKGYFHSLDFQPHIYIVVFFIFNDLRREMIVRFVDIGGIVDHHTTLFEQIQNPIGKL